MFGDVIIGRFYVYIIEEESEFGNIQNVPQILQKAVKPTKAMKVPRCLFKN